MKVIGVHLDRCTGCKTCELYCATERGSNSKTLLQAVQETPLPRPRLRVEGTNEVSLALQCRHCLNAPCLNACLNNALVRDPENQMVVVREDRCIACWTCTMFCPFGVIVPWPERKIALKCDRCAYMEHPICVEVCPCQALELIEINELERIPGPQAQDLSQKTAGQNRSGILLLDLD